MTFNIILAILIIIIIVIGLIKKVNVYNSFLDGAKQGLKITINMFSYLLTFTIAITLLKACGIIDDLINKINSSLSPLIIIQIIIKPLSFSSSLAMSLQIFETCGVDSYNAIISTLIHTCTDSTLYIMGFYYGTIEIKKYDQEIKYGLIINAFGIAVAIIIGTIVAYFIK